MFSVLIAGNTKYICRKAYQKLHGVGKDQMQNLINQVKNGDDVIAAPLNDTTNYGPAMRKKVEQFVDLHNINFSKAQIAAIQIPSRSVEFKEMVFWLDDYFATCGEFMPTKNGEVQLELITKYEIYAMYKQDSLRYNLKHLSSSLFYKAFSTVYPFVKIRRKKSVTGNLVGIITFLPFTLSCPL